MTEMIKLKIVEYNWHKFQIASWDGKRPQVKFKQKVYAIQEQKTGKYFYWAYTTNYIEQVMRKMAATWQADTLEKNFFDKPKEVTGRFRD